MHKENPQLKNIKKMGGNNQLSYGSNGLLMHYVKRILENWRMSIDWFHASINCRDEMLKDTSIVPILQSIIRALCKTNLRKLKIVNQLIQSSNPFLPENFSEIHPSSNMKSISLNKQSIVFMMFIKISILNIEFPTIKLNQVQHKFTKHL